MYVTPPRPFQAAGYDAKQTEKRLHDWNKKNDPPLTKIEIKRKVKSAFKPSAPAGPAAKYISRRTELFSFFIPSFLLN